ncbi:MAG: FAD-dependent oxidoreductase [Thermoanaerobaculum sp.]|nr:FAD-dependent oxidoreductase [Thermoanaerobaculum sp.]
MRVVVLGAGLSGLSAAWHLQRRGVEAVVLEREGEVGGACRTMEQEGFSFDYTGHLLHLRRPESLDLLKALGLDRSFRSHRRRAGILLAGRVTPYPIQIHTARLPGPIRRQCLLGFIRAWAQDPGEAENFGQWVLSRFGEGFAHHFFFPYNRKLFCRDPFDLTTEWVGRYVPRPELEDVVDGALGLFPPSRAVGYNARFLYPRRGGIGLLAQSLARPLQRLYLRAPVAEVDLAQREVVVGEGQRFAYDALVATGPLPQLVAMAHPLPDDLRARVEELAAVAVWNLNLAVRGHARRREHWLYCPEPHLPFYRVGFPSNHGQLAPPGHHTLSVEVSTPSGTAPPAGWEMACVQALTREGLLASEKEVLFTVVACVDPAYVIFDRRRPSVVAAFREFFLKHGVFLCGRWAEWKYSTMEDALWDGAAVARRLVGA